MLNLAIMLPKQKDRFQTGVAAIMRTISILLFAFLLSASAYAQGEPANADDGAFLHCSALFEFTGLPIWRDTGIPLARVENTLDKIITDDPPKSIPITRFELGKVLGRAATPQDMAHLNAVIKSEQSGLGAWRSVVASTPQDMADWNAAIESIYNSKITAKQIDRVLRKYCTNYTKHVFRASDFMPLFNH